MENFLYSPPDPSKRYGRSPVLTPQAGVFVHGGLVLADGTVRGSSSKLLVEFPLERYELYAHIQHPHPLLKRKGVSKIDKYSHSYR
jgi:hypothetical protein